MLAWAPCLPISPRLPSGQQSTARCLASQKRSRRPRSIGTPTPYDCFLCSTDDLVFFLCRVWSVRMNNYFSAVGYGELPSCLPKAITDLSSAILFFDYTLTFSTEVEYFWKSASASLFSVLFVVNRYFGLLGSIPIIFEYFTSPSEEVSYEQIDCPPFSRRTHRRIV